jgi:hypothetical protein
MMLARVADSLYWMGRYVERAEHMCRLSDVMLNATLDAATPPPRWRASCWPRRRQRPGKGQEPLRRRPLAGPRPRGWRLDHHLAGPRPRERPPGARPDHHRDLGAAEPHLPAGHRSRGGQGLQRRLLGLPARHHRRPAPVPRRGRRHHEPRRGLAVPAAGHVPGAGPAERPAAGGVLRRRPQAPDHRPLRAHQPAADELRAGALSAALHRRRAARADPGIPDVRRGLPPLDPVLHRAHRGTPVGRQPLCGRRATPDPSAWPAA